MMLTSLEGYTNSVGYFAFDTSNKQTQKIIF